MKHLLAFALAFVAFLPLPAQASGFHLAPWAEALLWLLLTPAGWAVLALAAVLVLVCLVALIRRKRGGR